MPLYLQVSPVSALLIQSEDDQLPNEAGNNNPMFPVIALLFHLFIKLGHVCDKSQQSRRRFMPGDLFFFYRAVVFPDAL